MTEMNGWPRTTTSSNSGARSIADVLESERRLAAEVEALRARVQAVRGVVEQVRRLAEDPIYVDSWDDWAVPSDDLRAILDGGDA